VNVPEATVECYSGHTYAQEPRVVVWQGRRYPIIKIEKRWRTPQGPAFQVRTWPGAAPTDIQPAGSSEAEFNLHYHEQEQRWVIQTLSQDVHNGGQGGPKPL
jgi:hypothetical protein